GKWNALAHYIRIGRDEGRCTSHVHEQIVAGLLRSTTSFLRRGRWKTGCALFVSNGDRSSGAAAILKIARVLATEHHFKCLALFMKRPALPDDVEEYANVV